MWVTQKSLWSVWIHIHETWWREFVEQSLGLFKEHSLYFHDLNVWLNSDTVRRNEIIVSLRGYGLEGSVCSITCKRFTYDKSDHTLRNADEKIGRAWQIECKERCYFILLQAQPKKQNPNAKSNLRPSGSALRRYTTKSQITLFKNEAVTQFVSNKRPPYCYDQLGRKHRVSK